MDPRFPPARILVPIDGSPPSWAGLDAALTIASRVNSRLRALHVQDLSERLMSEKDILAEIRRRAGAAGFPQERWSMDSVTGRVEVELDRRAGPRTCDLIVLGTHGREGAERFLMGSFAEMLFHRSRVPVLAVHEGAALEPRRLLVPSNAEPYADKALRYGWLLARAFGADVTVLHVADSPERLPAAEERSRLHVETAFGGSLPPGLTLTGAAGEARREIEAEALGGGYDLVALSSHRRDQLSDLALGTTAERLLRHCRLPVLAVPA